MVCHTSGIHRVAWHAGYKILFAGTPQVEEVKEENYDQNNEFGLLLLKVRPNLRCCAWCRREAVA
jgi:hypothetical protein